MVSLFPAEQTVQIRFSPPRSSSVAAGAVPYGVRVTSHEEPGFSVVEEGSVQIAGFSAVQARIVPRTSEGKRSAVHRLEITNTGNAQVTAHVAASDPDEALVFDIEPDSLTVDAGATATARVKLVADRSHSGRGTRRLPFNVVVEPGGSPVQVDAAFEQKPKGSVMLLVAIVAVAGLLVFLLKDRVAADEVGHGWSAAIDPVAQEVAPALLPLL